MVQLFGLPCTVKLTDDEDVDICCHLIMMPNQLCRPNCCQTIELPATLHEPRRQLTTSVTQTKLETKRKLFRRITKKLSAYRETARHFSRCHTENALICYYQFTRSESGDVQRRFAPHVLEYVLRCFSCALDKLTRLLMYLLLRLYTTDTTEFRMAVNGWQAIRYIEEKLLRVLRRTVRRRREINDSTINWRHQRADATESCLHQVTATRG